MRKMVLALVLILLGASGLEAQDYRAFTRGPVTQAQYATAIENNDRRVLNLDCTSAVQAFNLTMERQRNDTRFSSCAQLANYIRALQVKTCPVYGRTVGLARVHTSGQIDMDGYFRVFRLGESCLYDNNHGTWVASLSCGNAVSDRNLPVHTAMVELPVEPAPQPSEPLGPRREPGMERIQVDVNIHDQHAIVERRRPFIVVRRDWPWMTLAAGLIGAGVYCGVVSDTNCGMTQEVVIIHNN